MLLAAPIDGGVGGSVLIEDNSLAAESANLAELDWFNRVLLDPKLRFSLSVPLLDYGPARLTPRPHRIFMSTVIIRSANSNSIKSSIEGANASLVYPAMALVAGLLLRIHRIGQQALWYDELYSATQASVPLWDVPTSVRAFDMHPALYYLQLSLWQNVSSSDVWLRLNSTVWWLLAAISLYVIAKKLVESKQTALLALALFSLNPTAVHFGQELRMYSMLMCLSLWGFYFTERVLKNGDQATIVLLLLTSAAIIYSHGAGFIILLCMWAQACWLTLMKQSHWRELGIFFAVQAFAVGLGVPEHLRAASMHASFGGLSYAIAPSMTELLEQTAWLVAGRGQPLGQWTTVVTFGLIAWPLWAAVRTESVGRRTILCYVLVPIVAYYAISHLSKPIWVFRALSPFAPFVCLGLAEGVTRIWPQFEPHVSLKKMVTGVPFLAICLLMTSSLVATEFQQPLFPRRSNFAEAASVMKSLGQEGDTIYVAREFWFWSFCWYFDHPGSVQPLERQSQLSCNNITVMKREPVAADLASGGTKWMLLRSKPNETSETIRHLNSQGIDATLAVETGRITVWKLGSSLEVHP
ncbi:MAG: glycosyltransferase family 39 protein [Planctomycetales bacterium]|nr:glycosyltransferase family 39 protein [Planctomycetales bacterium]